MDHNKEHIKQYTAADIKRYLKGQLSGAEMHAIEKAALDDPFLADAIEGMGYAMEHHDDEEISGGLLELQRKVQARTTATLVAAPVRSFRWWQVAAAAVVLVVAGLGVFYFTGSEKQEIAKKDTVQATDSMIPPAKQPETFSEFQSEKASTVTDSSVALKTIEDAKHKAGKKFEGDLASSNNDYKELPLPSAPVQNKAVDTLKPGRQTNLDPVANKGYFAKLKEKEQEARRDSTERRNMASIPAEVVKTKDELKVRGLRSKSDNGLLDNDVKSQETKLQGTISGVVIDNNYNPQANALLRTDNGKATYNTDNRGNFMIPAGDSAVNLSVTVIGYGTQNFRLSNNTVDNQLRLQPANNSISNNRGFADKQYSADSIADNKRSTGSFKTYRPNYPKAVIQDAEPVYGWLSYEQYLEKNKRLKNTTSLPYEVVVSFQVNKKGELSDFKIEQPLSKEYDDEAIRLIKAGPAWKLLRGRKTRVTIIVRF